MSKIDDLRRVTSKITRARLSVSHKGKHHTDETKAKLSDFFRGRKSPMRGRHQTTKAKIKISEAQKKRFSDPKNHGPMYGKCQTTKTRIRISKSNIGKHTFSAEMRIRASNFQRKLWKDPEFARKVFSSCGRKPNKMELIVQKILNSLFQGLFKYVGNGKLFIDGKCPDFVSTDGSMLLIEFNGGYWHRGENTRTRARQFAKYGYRTLFIWSWELKNLRKLKSKIKKFVTQ